jgi:hypothetical protein
VTRRSVRFPDHAWFVAHNLRCAPLVFRRGWMGCALAFEFGFVSGSNFDRPRYVGIVVSQLIRRLVALTFCQVVGTPCVLWSVLVVNAFTSANLIHCIGLLCVCVRPLPCLGGRCSVPTSMRRQNDSLAFEQRCSSHPEQSLVQAALRQLRVCDSNDYRMW